MIHALDHIVVAAGSRDVAAADCEVLLGRRVDETAGNGDPACASIQLANVRLDLVTASASDRGGLAGLVFAVADLGKARQLLARRALKLSQDASDQFMHIDPASTHGTPLRVIERAPTATLQSASTVGDPDAAVTALDHVVIRSPDPERAVAFYAGRLGLSLRLDRSEPAWGARLLFFRCGDLIVEVAHDLKAGVSAGPDRLWGLSWRVPDIAKAHARMQAAGVEVSALRAGRRPGTRVFTAKSHTAGIPTLVIGMDGPGKQEPA
jgi:catechol 2,3-dioxygenase-like lactoylglutathione lyase family enzyme